MRRKLWIIGLAVVGLILAAGGAAWAAESARPRLLRGQVVAASDASLTVATKDGEVEVLIGDDTLFRVPGVPGATLADIPVGAQVIVQTKADGAGNLVASAVVVQAGPRLEQYVVRGAVMAATDEQVTVETADGALASLFLSDATRLWVAGEPPTSTVELAAGDPVLAFGRPATAEAGEKALAAQLVVVVSDEELPKFLVQGRALAVTRQTVVVETRRGERAITVLPRTRFWSAGGRGASLQDVRPGEQVIALGQPTEFGQWFAGLVLLPNVDSLARNGLRGEVIAKDPSAGTLTVLTEQRGEITVVTDTETRYRIQGLDQPGFDDIQVGDKIIALGRFEEGSQNTFLAKGIGVIPNRDA